MSDQFDANWLAGYQERAKSWGKSRQNNAQNRQVLMQDSPRDEQGDSSSQSGDAENGPEMAKMKRSKYGNKKVEFEGQKFDSGRELARWQELKALEKAGHIYSLERQRVFVLVPSVVLYGRKRPPIRYTADFSYGVTDGAQGVVEDVKSEASKTTSYKMRRHMMKHFYGVEIKETE